MQGAPDALPTIEHITSERDFDALEADWHRLTDDSTHAGLFNSWHWNRLWWQHYGDLGELFILVLRVDGCVQGIAPFYQARTRALNLVDSRTVRFIGTGGDTSPDDLDVLCNPSHQYQVLQRLSDYLLHDSSIERIQFQDMPASSAFYRILLDQADRRGWARPMLTSHARRVDVLPANIDQFEATLSRNARKARRRRRQRLAQAGRAQYVRCQSPEQVNQAFIELATLHRVRQASKGEMGSFASDAYNQFHRSLMLRALERDELRLVVLTLDGQTIAIEYAFLIKGSLCFFQTGFDPQYEQLSPGHLLMMHMIDEAITEGVREIDLLKGDYDYKASYAKQWQHSTSVDLWRSGLFATVYRLVQHLRSRNSVSAAALAQCDQPDSVNPLMH